MNHTPGPWTVQPGTVGAGRVQIVSPSYRKECDAEHVICELRPWQRPDYGPDAQLIAAAPELLAACQAIANDCERLIDGDDFSGMSDGDLFAAFLNALRPAIAKAEGRGE